MTTAAISPPRPRSFGLLGSWLSVRHSLRVEAAAALTLYGLYELTRDLVVSDSAQADAHAHRLVALERSLHLFVESNVQRAVQTLPGVTSLLGVAYLTLHLTVTAGVLLWLHRRRPEGFAFARTALLLASALSLVGFLVYPTAPPRLAGIGILDTVSGRHVDLNRGLVSSLYNPYAASPRSKHNSATASVATTVVWCSDADERPPTLCAAPAPRARSRDPRPARIRHERVLLVRRPARSPGDTTADRPLR